MTTSCISILGSGWLGLPLAAELVKQAYSINLSTKTAEKLTQLTDIGANAYLLDIEQIKDTNPFFNCSTLIINITSKNITAYQHLIHQIEQSPVKHVLFVSSSSVYLNSNTLVTESDQAENPDSPLYQIEQLFVQNGHFDTTVLRFSGLIGYNRHPGRFFKKNDHIKDPDAPVNLIHRDDCIGIIKTIIKHNYWGETLNGCSDSHPSKREFYSYARSLLGLAPPSFASNPDTTYKVVSNDKVKQHLNYQFIYPNLMTIPFESNRENHG